MDVHSRKIGVNHLEITETAGLKDNIITLTEKKTVFSSVYGKIMAPPTWIPKSVSETTQHKN